MKKFFATILLGMLCLTVRAVPAGSENLRERDCEEAEAQPRRNAALSDWGAYYDRRDRKALRIYRKENGGSGTGTYYPRVPLNPWLPSVFPSRRHPPGFENLRFFIDREYENAGTLRGEAEALLGRKVEPSDWIAYYDEREREEWRAFRKRGSGMKTRRLVPLDPWMQRGSPRRERHSDFKIYWKREALAALDTFSKAELVGALCKEIEENGTDECAELIARLWASVCADLQESDSPDRRREYERLWSRRRSGEEMSAVDARALREASFYQWRAQAIRDAFDLRRISTPMHVIVRVMEKYYDDDALQFCAWLKESRIFEMCRRKHDPERELRDLLRRYRTAERPVSVEASAFFLRGDGDSAEALSRADGDAGAAERSMSARSRAVLNAYRKIRGERFRALSERFPSPVLSESAEKEALAAVSGWRLPFEDYRIGAAGRPRFAYFDIRMKWLAATSLMSVSADDRGADAPTSAYSEAARERWKAGARLFGELLAEYQPGLEEKLNAEIDATPENRFNFYRQRAIRQYLSQRTSADIFPLFLAGLEIFYGNDFEAQVKICAETGVRGKIDLTRLRRPTLSDEAILQYEERAAQKEKEK